MGNERFWGAFRWLPLALAAVCSIWLAVAASPAGAQGSGYFVTFVARDCPAYTDIFANRARNNIVESLKDLGPDTQYPVGGGVLINPVYEDIPPQTNCAPITGWRFTLGTGIAPSRVSGVWGSLSVVSNPYSTSIVTEDSTPLLDSTTGQEIDGRTVAGATTIELTPAQRLQASRASQLWAQGGTPGDPVLAGPFPGPQYGFGTIRCASDNLNGDNVEYIYFPAGIRHVFCYGYYVKPPPTTGTITIAKKVVGAPPGTNPSFLFNGNLSFDPNGFTLSNGQSITLYRAGGVDWTVTESPVAGYGVPSISCLSANGAPASVTVSGATVTIHLAALDHVTCTYTNTYVPPPGGLTITKVTNGGVGSFDYDVTPVSGQGGGVVHATATTTVEGVPVAAQPSLTGLAPGTYEIVEHRPTTADGRWRLVDVTCNGGARSTTAPFEVTIASGKQVSCQFTNKFIPRGAISLSKVTEGATGSVVFQIERVSRTPGRYLQTATTTSEGVPARAVPNTPADATDRLRLGSYRIIEQPPPSTPAGAWTLTSVICDAELFPFAQGSTVVTLTSANPRVHCVYTDTFTPNPPPEPGPQPPEPPPPSPDIPPQPSPDQPASPWADLAINKTATPTVVAVGNVVTYRMTVTNHGPDDATRVILGDKVFAGATLVSVHTDVGHCTTRRLVICHLGTLKPRANVTITLRLRIDRRRARLTNRAVVGTETFDPRLTNNVSHATVRVAAPPAPPPFTG